MDYHGEKFVLVNPEVIEAEGSVTNEEGCLSFPGIYEKVTSPEKLTVVYQDETGAPRRLSSGFTACVFSMR
ncbi:MAG: peptide deformylase [Cloacibacillus evryensis]